MEQESLVRPPPLYRQKRVGKIGKRKDISGRICKREVKEGEKQGPSPLILFLFAGGGPQRLLYEFAHCININSMTWRRPPAVPSWTHAILAAQCASGGAKFLPPRVRPDPGTNKFCITIYDYPETC